MCFFIKTMLETFVTRIFISLNNQYTKQALAVRLRLQFTMNKVLQNNHICYIALGEFYLLTTFNSTTVLPTQQDFKSLFHHIFFDSKHSYISYELKYLDNIFCSKISLHIYSLNLLMLYKPSIHFRNEILSVLFKDSLFI